ncbi:MAG: 6-hydroxycyclohex-1-ene-1-carbonyl-CoA dehydrogenase [Deltaproteobacteria bacterium]|jgi:6-hydroxycyclohex-1-ene-1-carbonyl-CoA dehydrogenase|nr:6-hydroxycyclohex-1-ene-1-carbonyl-CoA dehydrogenase [Deltaproteobacteria bacterium]MBK7065285.1 6-hydroxycyclohex-1-ene-1-carbonyl-CoA dehydrogenase [Deltaproteobacteria bacterium]MBP6830960.1 6-hydroxycyclohex-1-ene-1-carbonyl-CoA dehydrogenase [Deltaproteobacteria bacterium]
MAAGSLVEVRSWQAVKVGEPMVLARRSVDTAALAPGDVLVGVAGCGVCHTDLGFLYDGVRTGKAFPLTLGHEIAGTVVAAGERYTSLVGADVVVPAVIPCGECALCLAGRGSICRRQVFPGSDVDGGFASHVVVPGRGLCVVERERLAASGVALADLSVLADAVSTAYQAIVRAGLSAGDVAVFVGVGGVGGFGVQIARALGAHPIAIDVSDERLAAMREFGAEAVFSSKGVEAGDLRKAVAAHVKAQGWNPHQWKIFETSGHPQGQLIAFALLTFGATLSVVGYTLEKVSVRLSNLMAFDAVAQGNWGCLPEHFPAALSLVLDGRVRLGPFIERRPMSSINHTFEALHRGELKKRPVLIPDFV